MADLLGHGVVGRRIPWLPSLEGYRVLRRDVAEANDQGRKDDRPSVERFPLFFRHELKGTAGTGGPGLRTPDSSGPARFPGAGPG